MTQEQVMKESRRLLFLMAALFLAWALAIVFRQASPYPGMRQDCAVVLLLGFICGVAGVVESFWSRLGCIAIWLLGMVYVLITIRGAILPVLYLVGAAADMVFRMFKYRGVEEEPFVLAEDDPAAQLSQAFTPRNVSPRTLIFAGMAMLVLLFVIDPWAERLKANWSQDLAKIQKSQGTRTK